jgi:hypothetical protein
VVHAPKNPTFGTIKKLTPVELGFCLFSRKVNHIQQMGKADYSIRLLFFLARLFAAQPSKRTFRSTVQANRL